ncbi:hypothetical protein [Hymenobacter sp.]|uniref:hypothetical protein n=1 Tax=Hymenobacter sp. TaxID=1898978 RepID=UPI00286A637F|nr:hypothetical protein [Hymenobacter sp.]
MTWLEGLLSALLLLGCGLALVARQRYQALVRKHKILQRLYDKAEAQLNTLWTEKRS